MIILIDTDILIDLALNRAPHAVPAGKLINALEHGSAGAWVAWHSISNFHYLVRPVQGRSAAKQFVLELLDFVQISPTTTQSLRDAIRFEMKDFEDAMQVAAALACAADVIATRNVKDYSNSPIAAKQPGEVLAQMA